MLSFAREYKRYLDLGLPRSTDARYQQKQPQVAYFLNRSPKYSYRKCCQWFPIDCDIFGRRISVLSSLENLTDVSSVYWLSNANLRLHSPD